MSDDKQTPFGDDNNENEANRSEHAERSENSEPLPDELKALNDRIERDGVDGENNSSQGTNSENVSQDSDKKPFHQVCLLYTSDAADE